VSGAVIFCLFFFYSSFISQIVPGYPSVGRVKHKRGSWI